MVAACFVGAGIYIWRGYKIRKTFFESLLRFCDHLLIEIGFSKNTIRHIIQTYGGAYATQFRAILQSYQTLLDDRQDITRARINAIMPKSLKPHELETITDFFYELGRHGSGEEQTKIQNKRVAFETFFDNAQKILKRDASMYLKLLIIGGIASVILLL
jgi:hypothetical protein